MTNTYETVREYALRTNVNVSTLYVFLRKSNINLSIINGIKMIGELEAKSIVFALSQREKKNFSCENYNKRMNIKQD